MNHSLFSAQFPRIIHPTNYFLVVSNHFIKLKKSTIKLKEFHMPWLSQKRCENLASVSNYSLERSSWNTKDSSSHVLNRQILKDGEHEVMLGVSLAPTDRKVSCSPIHYRL